MKRILLTAVLLSAAAMAQQQTTAAPPPVNSARQASAEFTSELVPASKSDLYCSGFVSRDPVARTQYVAGGLQTPEKVRFMERDFIFIHSSSLQAGSLVSIVREFRDPDGTELYKNVSKLLAEAGKPYADIGYARVIENRGADIAVAQIEFGCDSVLPGDLVLPFVPRPEVKVRKRTSMDRFPAKLGPLQGNIVMSRDADQMISTGRKVFLNLGSDKGVHVGDYFRVTRTYSTDKMDGADRATLQAKEYDDTQRNPQRMSNKKLGDLPPRAVGELVILNVTPKTATAMVTFMVEEIHVGDLVDLEESNQAVASAN